MTVTVAKVLRVFLEDAAEPRYGFDLMQDTGLASGTLYPILARLEGAGWIIGEHEAIDPEIEGRPARRYYVLTAEGAKAAREELAQLSERLRPPAAVRRSPRLGENPI